MKIGVFDSGIGGLTVLNILIKNFPNNEYIYYGDTKNLPYGNKSIEELKILSSNIIEFLINEKVELIIIACGTISSNLNNYLKNKYDIKIVDIVSPTINYINNSNYNKIGVIATQATINSKIFSKKINKDVKEVACPMFVPLIESNNLDKMNNYFDKHLNDLMDRDLIVLGCTHYPIIKDKINNYFNNSIKLLDMSECIGNITNVGKGSIKLYFTKIDETIENNIKNILNTNDYSINLAK